MISKRNAIIIVGGFFVVAIIILSVVGILKNNNPSNTTGYKDPGSGETVISGNAPQGSADSLENAIIFPGFSDLINRGLSPTQIQTIQSTFAGYSLKQSTKFKEVSLTIDSIRHILPQGESTTQTLNFDVTVDRKTAYFVSVEYQDTTSCSVKIYAADKTTLLFTQ